MKVFISTHPFGTTSSEPINIIKYNNFDYAINSYGG